MRRQGGLPFFVEPWGSARYAKRNYIDNRSARLPPPAPQRPRYFQTTLGDGHRLRSAPLFVLHALPHLVQNPRPLPRSRSQAQQHSCSSGLWILRRQVGRQLNGGELQVQGRRGWKERVLSTF